MGRERHSSLFSFESKKCACSIYQSAKVKACCEDETELVKIDNDQVHSSSTDLSATEWSLLPVITFELTTPILSKDVSSQVVSYNLPPPKVPIYQLVCSWKVGDLKA